MTTVFLDKLREFIDKINSQNTRLFKKNIKKSYQAIIFKVLTSSVFLSKVFSNSNSISIFYAKFVGIIRVNII